MGKYRLPALVGLITALAFLRSLENGFVDWDDEVNFMRNLNFRGLGWAQLKWMFTDIYGHYMPLTWLTLGFDYVIWGLNPVGYHLTSLLFHALNASLFFFVLLALLRRASPDAPEIPLRWAAAAGALLFSLHPLRVESVAWATERRDVVSGMFFLLSILAYLRGGWKWVSISAALFAGSLLSKAMGMGLPLVLLAIDLYPLRRKLTREVWLEKVPFLLLMIGSIALTRLGQSHAEALYTSAQYGLKDMLLQPGFRLCFYVGKTVWPLDLSPLYLYRASAADFKFISCGLLALGTTALLVWKRREWPWALGAGWSYAVLVGPVIGLIQAGPHFAADRYTYLACLPFAVLGAAAVLRWRGHAVAGVLVAILAGLTWRQTAVWKDSITLWDHAIAIDHRLHIGYNNRGLERKARGDAAGAMADYDRALQINPRYKEAWYNRGVEKVARKDYDGAIADYSQAIKAQARYAEGHNSRGAARQYKGDLKGAIEDYDEAIRFQPGHAGAWANRAMARAAMGDGGGAIADFTEALRLNPGHVESWAGRGLARAARGDFDGALADYAEAIRRNPGFPDAWVNRGVARATRKDFAGAAADFEKALEVASPSWPHRKHVEGMLQKARRDR